MRFFDRKQELDDLAEIRRRSDEVAQFTVVTSRRRVGKTSLVIKSLEKEIQEIRRIGSVDTHRFVVGSHG